MPISPHGWKEVHGDVLPPPRPLSAKTRMEQWAGRKLQEKTRLEATLPPADFAKYSEWSAAWRMQCPVSTTVNAKLIKMEGV